MESTRTNKYPAHCDACDRYLPAGQGAWAHGNTYCGVRCEEDATRQAQERINAEVEARRQLQQTLIATALTPETPQTAELMVKATNGRVTSLADLQDANAEDVNAVMIAVAKRDSAKRTRAKREEAKRTNTCTRCGGAGRADKWERTGSICYKCNGSGKDHE